MKATREAKRSFTSLIAADLENEARLNNTRAVYQKVGELVGSSQIDMSNLREKDGQLILGGMDRVRERWKESFGHLLNAGKELDEECLHDLSAPSNDSDEPCPTEDEVETAIKKLKKYKACGVDGVYGEMLKAGGDTMVKILHRLFTRV